VRLASWIANPSVECVEVLPSCWSSLFWPGLLRFHGIAALGAECAVRAFAGEILACGTGGSTVGSVPGQRRWVKCVVTGLTFVEICPDS